MAPVATKKDSSLQKLKNKVRGSKHKKKSWRHGSNVQDVEEFLNEKRKDGRFKSKAQRTDDELFLIQRKIGKPIDIEKIHKEPKFKYLQVENDIEPIVKPPNANKKVKSRNPIQKAKFKLAESKLGTTSSVKKNRSGSQFLSLLTAKKDIWEEDEKTYENDYLKEADEFFQQQTCKKQIKPPSSYYIKPSTLPGVEVPDPGASYNPSYEDHQKLLNKAREIEVKKQKEEEHLNRILTSKFPTLENAPTEATWLKEMSQGLNEEKNDDEESENEDDDLLSFNPPTLNNKKTKAKRNKEMRQKLLEKKIRTEKKNRRRENEVFKIKSFLTGVKKKEKFAKQRLVRRIDRKIKERAKPKRLGRVKYEDPEMELTLSTELKGTLREMKPMGSLLEDRMKSLQRRNIIEPIVRQKNKRKYKRKTYVKKSHKE